MKLRYWYILVFWMTPFSAMAQANYEVGVLPEFNFGTKLSTLWSLDAEVAARYETFSGTFGHAGGADIYFGLVDVTAVFNRTIGVDAKLGFGYLSRFENNNVTHRLIQQYAFTVPKFGYRLGHRFRIDETFAPGEALEVRLRYRISSDISLNGEFIDPSEFYLKIGNEYVYRIQDSTTDLEIRIVPTLGYYLNDDNKIEMGVDYRIDSFLEDTADHRFWLNMGYYLSL